MVFVRKMPHRRQENPDGMQPPRAIPDAVESLSAQLMQSIQDRVTIPENLRNATRKHTVLIATRATNIHDELKTMPRNVRDGIQQAVDTLVRVIPVLTDGVETFSQRLLPTVLSEGAAFGHEETSSGNGPSRRIPALGFMSQPVQSPTIRP